MIQMTPDDVKRIQTELSDAIGARISDGDLGDALGLEPKNAPEAVRRWKTKGPTGPVAAALRYLDQGLPNEKGEAKTPEYVFGSPLDNRDMLFVVRLHFPRFVGWVESRMLPANDYRWTVINRNLHFTVTQWIDDLDLAAFNASDREELLADVAREIDAELQRRERG